MCYCTVSTIYSNKILTVFKTLDYCFKKDSTLINSVVLIDFYFNIGHSLFFAVSFYCLK